MARELHKSKNPWKLEKINASDRSEEAEKKNLIRKVRSILNRLTPTNEGVLAKEFLALNVCKSKSMNEVVSLIFMKAIDEPKFVEVYTRLCCHQINEDKRNTDNVSHFRNHILYIVQESFHRKKEEQAAFDARDKLKRKRLGIIRFTSHLYLKDVISVRIVHFCNVYLLTSISEIPCNLEGYQTDDDSVEEALLLLEIIGKRLKEEEDNRNTEIQQGAIRVGRAPPPPRSGQEQKFPLDATFETLEKAMPLVSPRTRYLIMNLMELRARDWVPWRVPDVPKTLAQIREEMRKEQLENDELRRQFELRQERINKEERNTNNDEKTKTRVKKRLIITPQQPVQICAPLNATTASGAGAIERPTEVKAKCSIDTSIAVDTFDDLSDQCSCPICHEIFDSANFVPYILNCGHSFCKICVAKVCINNAIKCSLCEMITELPDGKVLSTNYQLLGISEKVMNSRVEAKLSCKICEKKFSPDGICVCMKEDCEMFKHLLCLRCAIQTQHGGHVINYDAKMVETRESLRKEVAAVCSTVDEKKKSVIAKAEELEKITQEMKKRISEAKIPAQIIAQIDSLTSDQDVSDYREIVNDLAKTLIEGCEAVEGAFKQAIETANQQFELAETKDEAA